MDFLNPQDSFYAGLQWPGEDGNFNFDEPDLTVTTQNLEDVDSLASPSPTSGSLSGFGDTPSPTVDYPGSGSPSTAASSSTAPHQQVMRIRKKPTPRKGHTKSRTGCFSCKKRRIKCQETRPACENCRRSGLPCEYPRPRIDYAPSSGPQYPLQATPTLFSLTDMRIFHHFLFYSYPHLPVGDTTVWPKIMPGYAQHYDFLMHAILALGASHITLTTGDNLNREALQHRVRAVASLNKAMSQPPTRTTDADARFGAFFALAFQTTCMQDGLMEWLTVLRGCVLQMGKLGEDSVFIIGLKQAIARVLEKRKNRGPPIRVPGNYAFAQSAVASLNQLEPLCPTDVERNYLQKLVVVADNTCNDPQNAYMTFVSLYWYVGHLSAADFTSFTSPSNPVAQILLCHFLAIHFLLRDLEVFESVNTCAPAIYLVMHWWVRRIHDDLHPDLKKYNRWPMKVVADHAFSTHEPPRLDWRSTLLNAPTTMPIVSAA